LDIPSYILKINKSYHINILFVLPVFSHSRHFDLFRFRINLRRRHLWIPSMGNSIRNHYNSLCAA